MNLKETTTMKHTILKTLSLAVVMTALPAAELPRVLEGGFEHRQRDLLALLHGTGTENNP